MNNQPMNMDEKNPVRPTNDGPPPYSGIDPAASAPPPASINASETQNTNPAKSLPVDTNLDLPELPTVPSGTPSHDPSPDTKKGDDDNDDDIDFDDLTRRFEALKKKK